MTTLERLERVAQRLEEASELALGSDRGTLRSCEYLAAAATVRAQWRAELRTAPVVWERLEGVLAVSERLADSARTGSAEQRAADGATLTLDGLLADVRAGWL